MSEAKKGIEGFVGSHPFGKKMPLTLDSVMPFGSQKGERIRVCLRDEHLFPGLLEQVASLLVRDIEIDHSLRDAIERKIRAVQRYSLEADGNPKPKPQAYSAKQVGWIGDEE